MLSLGGPRYGVVHPPCLTIIRLYLFVSSFLPACNTYHCSTSIVYYLLLFNIADGRAGHRYVVCVAGNRETLFRIVPS